MAKIGMIGAGSWGTALTWLLTNNGHQVTRKHHRLADLFQGQWIADSVGA